MSKRDSTGETSSVDEERVDEERVDEEPVDEERVDEERAGAETREQQPEEYGGPKGKEPTRYGDWEKKGRCIDF
jgi:hypothetical protein